MKRASLKTTLLRWIDSSSVPADTSDRIDWLRVIPFIGLHLMCLGVIWVGVSPIAVAVAVGLYGVRMFAITAFYHRYFGHRAFQTSRPVQLIFAALASSAAQRGPLWWASHHRAHHRHADTEEDAHSPDRRGFWWSHAGWFLSRANFPIRWRLVRDFERFPELRFLDRFDVLMPALLGLGLFGMGEVLAAVAPHWGTSGAQLLIWGFFVSTVVLYHATFCINSLAHRVGSRRYETRDASRNNALLALLTLGEGWHNNHHHYPASARQGFRWWELDLTYWGLRLLAVFGIVWKLRPVPAQIVDERGERATRLRRLREQELSR